jgi:Cdc6-like AAA superfamily ATPase
MEKTTLNATDNTLQTLFQKPFQKPKRFFEDSGTVNPQASYYVLLDNVTNTKGQDFKTMIDVGRYFSIFAPRQSGKTTFMKETCRLLNTDPVFITILLSFQDYSTLNRTRFYGLVGDDIFNQLIARLTEVNCEKTESVRELGKKYRIKDNVSFRLFFEKLNQVLQFKKIVILIDEFDGIPSKELESFLHSLRRLYQDYKEAKQKALYSVGLI